MPRPVTPKLPVCIAAIAIPAGFFETPASPCRLANRIEFPGFFYKFCSLASGISSITPPKRLFLPSPSLFSCNLLCGNSFILEHTGQNRLGDRLPSEDFYPKSIRGLSFVRQPRPLLEFKEFSPSVS